MGPITGVYAGDKSAFSIHCYRNMLATDFAAYGLPSSLRKPTHPRAYGARLRARATTEFIPISQIRHRGNARAQALRDRDMRLNGELRCFFIY